MTTEIVRPAPTPLAALEPRSLEELTRLAATCAGSGLFAVRSPEQAAVIMLTGASLGIAPVVALRSIHVVQGRAVLSSDLIAAIVRRSGLCESWRVDKSTPEQCTITTKRRGEEPYSHTWTLAMAQRASLAGKGTWGAYPAAMLRARCTSEIARIVYPDVLVGVYEEGELEAAPEEPARAPVEAPALSLPAVVEAPEQTPSRAFASYVRDLDATVSPDDVRAAYVALLADLREEDPSAEYLSGYVSGPDGAHALARARVRTIGLDLSDAETTALLSDEGAELARLWSSLGHVRTPETLAAWWLDRSPAMGERVKALTWGVVVRRSGEPGKDFRGRCTALAAARAVPTEAPSPEDWRASLTGMGARVATLDGAPAVLAEARAEWSLAGYAPVLTGRLVSLGMSRDAAREAVARAQREGREEHGPREPEPPKARARRAPPAADANGTGSAPRSASGSQARRRVDEETLARDPKAWAAYLAAIPRTPPDDGAAHVAGSYWKREGGFREVGTHAECLAATLDELTTRGVSEPHSWLAEIGERNGYVLRAA